MNGFFPLSREASDQYILVNRDRGYERVLLREHGAGTSALQLEPQNRFQLLKQAFDMFEKKEGV